jgi:apolipoprotein N-acyltransferase
MAADGDTRGAIQMTSPGSPTPLPTAHQLLLALLAALVAAPLAWYGTGLEPSWPLAWLAPLPLLLLAPRVSTWVAGLAALVAWFAGGMNAWSYYHRVLGIPVAAALGVPLAAALVFALAVVLHRALLVRRAPVLALLAFPSAWVSYEYLLNLAAPHGTFGSLAYTQLEFLTFLQFASVAGPWGMTFLLLSFPAALAVAFHLRPDAPARALAVLVAAAGIFSAVLLFGLVRLSLPVAGPRVKVALLATDARSPGDVATRGPETAQLLEEYATRAAGLAEAGAQVVVLPEKLGVVTDAGMADVDALFQPLAEETRATIVVGVVHSIPPARVNEARIYVAGAPPASYLKHHLLPRFESSFVPGTAMVLLPAPSGPFGVTICKDMDFTALSRAYGRAGAGLLLVPAWDFVIDRWLHGRMAVMRAVESGFAVARSARHGLLTICDSRGRILAETESDSAQFAELVAEVPVAHAATFFLLVGDRIAWLALCVLAVSLVRACAAPPR